jgi:hypothetical protein
MTDLFDQYRSGDPLVIEHPQGSERLMAAFRRHGSGLAFADIGWPVQDSSFPFHLVEGPFRFGDYGWEGAPVNGQVVVIRPLASWEGSLQREWALWQAWCAEHPEWDDAAAQRALAEYAREIGAD